jgi:hypothetical protein
LNIGVGVLAPPMRFTGTHPAIGSCVH